MAEAKKPGRAASAQRLALPAIGLEAECSLMLDDQPTRPEALFGSPRDFIRGELVHREGTSYHLPNGGAVYFDTGVIEVATPVVEIERGCAARAGRSLWEAIGFIRGELDDWDARNSHRTRLVGFSTHYNVSFELPPGEPGNGRTIDKLAHLLTYILPAPVMLLATNRLSTGVGVRPRKDRIEITSDLTPSPTLMVAAATLIVGVVREVMKWPTYELMELSRHGIPVVRGYRPMPHTSRKGWLAKFSCYPGNPFACDVDRDLWPTERDGELSLRGIARRTVAHFGHAIRRIADPFTLRLIAAVVRGRHRSLLDLAERPAAYEDVGRSCAWDELLPPARLARSRYERVVMRAISGAPLVLQGRVLRPVGMSGWTAIRFRGEDGHSQEVAIDDLVPLLDRWAG